MSDRQSNRTALGLKGLQALLYLAAVVIINVAASSLFVRLDLTETKLYSLSPESIDAVSSLQEPLTIRAFFSPNLPAPYNNVEQAVRDLLEEYAAHGGTLFNYQFYSMGDEANDPEQAAASEQLAQRYLIYPIQIEELDRDEVKLTTAFTGLALIHGDLIETIPSVTNTDRIELSITEAIASLTERVSKLLALEDDIQVRLYFSSTLGALGAGVSEIPAEIEALVDDLNATYFDRLAYSYVDPSQSPVSADDASRLRLTPLALQRGGGQDAGQELAYAGITASSGDTTMTLNLVQGGVFGYQLADNETVRRSLDDTLKNLLGTQEEIGYLADFETPPYRGRSATSQPPSVVEPDLTNLFQLISKEYTYRGLLLETREVPEGIRSILVVAPQEKISDWALFQLDQFLLRGGSLIMFLDSHDIYIQEGGGFGGGGAFHLPRDTGIEALIEHYGIRLVQSYAMDEQAFVQRQRSQRGGFVESEIYFAPLIKQEQMQRDLPFLRNLGDMIMLNISPLEAVGAGDEVSYTVALRTSATAWEMAENIDLMRAQPPAADQRRELPLAILAEGRFTSYFAGRELPERPVDETAGEADENARVIAGEALSTEQTFLPEGSGKLFVVGTSAVLGSNLIDPDGLNPNALFVINLVDYMNGRADRALMRSKGERVRPLRATTPQARTATKTFAVAGLPALVVLAGVIVWLLWSARKGRIRAAFGAPAPADAGAGSGGWSAGAGGGGAGARARGKGAADSDSRAAQGRPAGAQGKQGGGS